MLRRLYWHLYMASATTVSAATTRLKASTESCIGNAYGEFFPTLASKGIEVRAFDQRGFGRSVHKPSEKGLTGPTSLVLSDISSFLKTMLPPAAPLFLMGHSMGGAEVLCWARDGTPEVRRHVRGYLAEAPFIAFHGDSKPSVVTVVAGRLAGRVLPHRQMVFKLDEKLLSRDGAVQRAFVEDALCHDTGTLEGMVGNLDRAAGLDSGKIRVPADAGEGGKTRIWLSHGTSDGVCDYRSTQKVYDRLDGGDDKALKLYDGWYHKRKKLPSTSYRVPMLTRTIAL
jgi:acylglycerol lipase